MARRKKYTFKNPKMFSSRVEREDYYKVERKLHEDGLTLQQFLNAVVRGYITGSVEVDSIDGEVIVK